MGLLSANADSRWGYREIQTKNSEGSYQEPFPEDKNQLHCCHPRISARLLVSPNISISCCQDGKGNGRWKGQVLCIALAMDGKGQDQDDGDRPVFKRERGK